MEDSSTDERVIDRRAFLAQAAAAGALLVSCGSTAGGGGNLENRQADAFEYETDPHTLPPLGYAYTALEPYIDAKTMELHHDKHHETYVKNLNEALKGEPLANLPVEEILTRLDEFPEGKRTAIRNNGGGHANHTLFWKLMTPGGRMQPGGELADAINRSFGSFAGFKRRFEEEGKKLFGSGWVWLTLEKDRLALTTLPDQDSPLLNGSFPIMGNDVWEHAYYLKYQNRRADYLTAWWNVVNWDKVAARYEEARKR
jgi:Fe-Mn family superoxide dismutase